MNQLFEVMQSADVVIGIGARFSLGNPAGDPWIPAFAGMTEGCGNDGEAFRAPKLGF